MGQIKPPFETFARIKVVGVGGAGNKAIQRMVNSKIHGVDFIAVNLDAQDLNIANVPTKILIGKNLTRGLGAGMNPEVGRQAAMDSSDEIADALKNSDMVFVTAGMGGGTGSGAAPVVAEIARELGALTIGVVTKPFSFEGAARSRIAEEAWTLMKEKVDSLITISNDRILSIIDRKTPLLEAFAKVDDVLRHGVQGISDLITITGLINIDLSDVKTIMTNSGSALMGIGFATGDDRAVEAAKVAINSPLLEIAIDGARGVLFNVSGGADLAMSEISDVAKVITERIDPNAKVIFGAVQDDKLKKGEIKVTVIATGFSPNEVREVRGHSSLFDDVYHSSFNQPSPQPIQPVHRPNTITTSSSVPTMGNGNGHGNGSSYGTPHHPAPSPVSEYTPQYPSSYNSQSQYQPAKPQPPVVKELVDSSVADDDDTFEIPAFIRRKMKN